MIRLATPADVDWMIRLERECAGASHWGEERYRQLIHGQAEGIKRLVFVMEATSTSNSGELAQDGSVENSALLGFLVARQVPPEWELENIAVDPSMRRTGLGTELLGALLLRAKQTNSESVFLEVRESNQTARRFYERAGFHQVGRRKSYYAEPSEDAILYQMTLKQANPRLFSY